MSARITMWSAKVLAAAVLIGTHAPLAHAQSRPAPGTIDGIVTDTNLVSLADATASILGSSIQVVTGANGRFRILAVPPGQYILVVRRLGFAPSSAALRVAEGDTLRMSFTLERVTTALDTVVVATKRYSMRMAEFEDRRKLGFGQFMTQAEIDKRNSVFTSELFRTFQAVDVRGQGLGARVAMNRRSPISRPPCPFQLYLDGVMLRTPTSLDDLPSTRELAGIEVYSSPATIPLPYKSTGGAGFCGVILVWTRDGS